MWDDSSGHLLCASWQQIRQNLPISLIHLPLVLPCGDVWWEHDVCINVCQIVFPNLTSKLSTAVAQNAVRTRHIYHIIIWNIVLLICSYSCVSTRHQDSYREWRYHMLLVYNYVLLKMSTWCSKHVEESNNILRINNSQCIKLVIIVCNV